VAGEVLDQQRAQLGLVVDDEQLRAGCRLTISLLSREAFAAVYRCLPAPRDDDAIRRGRRRAVKQMKPGARGDEAAPIPPAATMAAIDPSRWQEQPVELAAARSGARPPTATLPRKKNSS
jgi:hypothetical protein